MSTFENEIGYKFKKKTLLKTAFTHSSYSNENKSLGVHNYERLEFLGDAILGAITAVHLFKTYQNEEGELTKMRAALVCEQNLAAVAQKLELGKYMILGKGEELTHGRTRPSILADLVEAIIGAIYLDGGIEPASRFIHKYVLTDAADASVSVSKDYKTELQEIVQRDRDALLAYRLVSESGPDHDKLFVAEAVINGVPAGTGRGHSKKEAEQAAAMDALSGGLK